MKLLVVIVCYRVTDLTIDCLRSLDGRIQRVPDSRVAVVENGTGGDSAQRIRQALEENGWNAWADLTVIHPNLGFTGGNNVAIRAALDSDDPPEYVLLLNADTVVLDGALESLVGFMDTHPDVGIAGSQCLAADGKEPIFSHGPLPGPLSEFDRGLRLGPVSRLLRPWIAAKPLATPGPVGWLPGATMICRASMLRRIGLLDEGLYTYFDDLDMCLRAKRAGWPTWFVPRSRIIHLVGQSTGVTDTRQIKRTPAYWFQARRRYYLKSHGPLVAALTDGAYLVGAMLYQVRRRIQRKPNTDPPHHLGDFFRHSVFRAGFRIEEVENPALSEAAR